MKLLIFGGTTEGRQLSHLLAQKGAQVTVSVATDYGKEEQGQGDGVTVLTGRLDVDRMVRLLAGFDLCIDATHPYAVEATANIKTACERASVPCRRLLRRDGGQADGIFCDSAAEAARYLEDREGRILLTTGAKELSVFSHLGPDRLYPRVLPSHAGISACEEAGIPHRNILAMQGPFSEELNTALLRQFHISYLVTKEGGTTGGFPEKVRAAQSTGTQLVIIRRPEDQGESFDEILKSCEEMMRCS